jgi:hypothetical protein
MSFASVLVFLCFSFNVFSLSDNRITWGKLEKSEGIPFKIVLYEGHNLLLMYTIPSIFPRRRKLLVREIESLSTLRERSFYLQGNGKNISASAVMYMDKSLVSIGTKTSNMTKRTEVFTHVFDPKNQENTIIGSLIVSYLNMAVPSVFKKVGAISSIDNSNAALFYSIPVKPTEFVGFGYLLFNQVNGKYAQNIVQLPFVQNQLEFSDFYMSAFGDFYVTAREFDATNNAGTLSEDNRSFSKIHLFKANEVGITQLQINEENFFVRDIKILQDSKNTFVSTGFYAEDLLGSVRGHFYVVFDKITNRVILRKKQLFGAEFLSSGQAIWDQSWRQRTRISNQGQNNLSNLKFLDFLPLRNGGFIAMAESQQVILVARNSGSPQNPKTTYVKEYHYNDLIVYKLDSLGDMEWARRVPKKQVSTEDSKKYLSVTYALTQNNLHVFYNDNAKNYSSNGDFLGEEYQKPMLFISGNNVITHLQIELQQGSISRKAMPGLSENRVVLVPKICAFNQFTEEMTFFGQHLSKQRLGIMKIGS